MKRIIILIWPLLLIGLASSAHDAPLCLSLDSCRALAMQNNKALRMANMRQRAAYYERKAALTNYMPRVEATGGYLHTSRELSLLSSGQKNSLANLGTSIGALAPLPEGMAGVLNGVGTGLADALHTDTRNMGAAAVMLTQPVYVGGKIAAYSRIARYADQVAEQQHDLAFQEVLVEVDEAYWQIVALQARKHLANLYLRKSTGTLLP